MWLQWDVNMTIYSASVPIKDEVGEVLVCNIVETNNPCVSDIRIEKTRSSIF